MESTIEQINENSRIFFAVSDFSSLPSSFQAGGSSPQVIGKPSENLEGWMGNASSASLPKLRAVYPASHANEIPEEHNFGEAFNANLPPRHTFLAIAYVFGIRGCGVEITHSIILS